MREFCVFRNKYGKLCGIWFGKQIGASCFHSTWNWLVLHLVNSIRHPGRLACQKIKTNIVICSPSLALRWRPGRLDQDQMPTCTGWLIYQVQLMALLGGERACLLG